MRIPLKAIIIRFILAIFLFIYVSYFAWQYLPAKDSYIIIAFFLLYLGSSILDTFMVKPPLTFAIKDDDRKSYIYLQLTSMVILFYGILDFVSFQISRAYPCEPYIMMVGFVLFLIAILLRCLGLQTLGTYFNLRVALYEEHQLITTGIYSKLRHPLYLAALLTVVAFACIFSSYGALLLVLLLVVPAILYRIRIEEEFLSENFKTEYQDYMKQTKRIIPGIW